MFFDRSFSMSYCSNCPSTHSFIDPNTAHTLYFLSHIQHLWTPLHYASAYNHIKMTDLLIKRGANVNAKDMVLQIGRNCLCATLCNFWLYMTRSCMFVADIPLLLITMHVFHCGHLSSSQVSISGLTFWCYF